MTRVDFDFASKQAAVPVEIYDEDLVLVERRLSSEPTTLKPGAYFAISRSPAGREVQAKFHVGTSTAATVSLGVVSEQDDTYLEVIAPRRIGSIIARFVRRSKEPSVRPYERLPDGEWKRGAPIRVGEERVDRDWPDTACAIVLERRDAPTLFVRFPGAASPFLTVRVRPGADGPPGIDANLRHPDAAALLSYLDTGQIELAAVLAESSDVNPETMLQEKAVDPLAAAAGAYVLLQLGQLERLHDWTANLRDRFDWLPDGLVVSAEHRARMGKHEAALADLRQLPERGLPCLSVGLGMATDRLRSYARRWPEDEQLQETLEELTRYAVATDFSAPVTTFAGEAPDRPGVAPPTPPSQAGRILRRLVPDVLERSGEAPVFRFRLPKRLGGRGSPTTNRRSTTMADMVTQRPGATTPTEEGGQQQEEDSRLTVVRVSFAALLTAVFLIAAFLLYSAVDTQQAQEWERLVYIFGAIEALAFTAIGWVFGSEVNRQRADSAEKRADGAEAQKDAEKEKGATLAGLVAGEQAGGGGGGGGSKLQPQGPASSGGGQSPALDFARRHYGV